MTRFVFDNYNFGNLKLRLNKYEIKQVLEKLNKNQK